MIKHLKLNKTQKLMAEEILDKNPGAVILQPPVEGGKLPDIKDMVPVLHVGEHGCQHVAFYYTHVLDKKYERPIATRAKFPDGSRPDRDQPMVCGSCGERIHFFEELHWVVKQ